MKGVNLYGEVEILQEFYEETEGTGFGPLQNILELSDTDADGAMLLSAGCWTILVSAKDKLTDH